jgi:hypothetical protein
MAGQSHLLRDIAHIEDAIERHCASGPGLHKQREPLRRELLHMLVLRQPEPPTLGTVPFTRLRKINSVHAHRIWRLSCAIYLWKQHKVSKTKAARLATVPESELDYVESLAARTNQSLLELSQRVDEKVLAEVDGYLEHLTVSLDQRAVEDILLAAAETYAVKAGGKGKKYTEVYGLCFGTRKDIPPNGSPEFRQILNVTRVVTQIRARARASEVTPNDKSARIHRQVAERFFKHLELLGDYHTHPFHDLATLKARRGWEYSSSDQAAIPPWLEDCRAEGADPRFSVIVAIAKGGKPGRHAVRLAPNRVQFTINEYFFIIAAYRIRRDGLYDKKIVLDCPQVAADA